MEREKKEESTRNPDPDMYRPRGRRSRMGERARDEMLRTETDETLTGYRYAEVCAEKKKKRNN